MHTPIRLYRDFGSDLLQQVGGAIKGGIGGAIGQGMGLLFQGINNDNQAEQQQRLLNQQVEAQKQLSTFNFQQQLDMWNKTNYEAQVAHLNAAGLNPALLYGKGGGGGTTTGSPSGGAGMGIAPYGAATQAGLQATLQAQETAADVKLKNAQADNIAAQTPQTADLMNAQIQSINQGINNAKAQEILTDAQTQTQRLQNSIQGESLDDQIAAIRATSNKIQNETQQAVRNNWMDQQTMNDKIQTIHGIMIGTFVENQLRTAQTTQTQTTTKLTDEQIKQIGVKIAQDWKQLDINAQNANTNEGQLKLQQLIKNIPDAQHTILQGLTRLIPNIIL